MRLSDKNNFRVYAAVFTAGLLLLLVAVNVFADGMVLRWDLTEDSLYSLSPLTRNLMGELPDKVTVKAYFSEGLPSQYQGLRREVEDVLEEYAEYSGGRFVYEFVDPALDNRAAISLENFGIEPTPMVEHKGDRKVQTRFHHSLILYYRNRAFPIKSITSTLNLEYNLTSIIIKFIKEELPVVAFLSGHDEYEPYGDYSAFTRELEKSYFVTRATLENGYLTPSDPDVLIIAKPSKPMTNRTLYEIDQYVMRGGKVIFLLDRIKQTEVQPVLLDVQLQNLTRTIESYGVEMPRRMIYRAIGQGEHIPLPPEYYYVIFSGPASDHVTVKDAGKIPMAYSFPIEYQGLLPEGVKVTKLLETTQDYFAKDGPPYLFNPERERPTSAMETFNTAVMLSGEFPSAFLNRPIPDPGENASDVVRRNMLSKSENTEIVVAGDADFLTNELASTAGITLMLNVVDFLAIGDDLIKIRSRTVKERKLAPVSGAAVFLVRFLNIAAVPLVLILLGLVRYYRRRSLKFRAISAGETRKPPQKGLEIGRSATLLFAAGWALFVILVVVPFLIPDKQAGGETEFSLNLFPPFSEETVARVTIEQNEATMELKATPDGWVLDGYHDHPAVEEKVQNLFSTLRRLPPGDIRSTGESSFESFRLTDEEARKLTLISHEGEKTISLLVGMWKPRTDETFVRLPGKDIIRAMPGNLTTLVSAEKEAWFDKKLFEYPAAVVQGVEIAVKDKPVIQLGKHPQEGFWVMVRPEERVPRQEDAAELVNVIRDMRADSVADRENFGKYGLEDPRGTVTVITPIGQTIYYVGGEVKEGEGDNAQVTGYYVRRMDRPFVYVVSRLFIDDILIEPGDLR